MKNRMLAMLVVLMLLGGAIATSINIKFDTKADVMFHLDVYTDPSGIPINGTGDYTDGSYVELQAIDPYISGNVKYVFDYWKVDGSYWGTANPLQWVFMNQDHNATAVYKTYYKLKFNPTPYAAQGVTEWIYVASWVQTNEAWVLKNTLAYVGVKGLYGAPPGVYIDPDKWAYMVNFTGDATNMVPAPGLPGYKSDPINMTGPKTADTEWAFMYTLKVLSGSPPPPPPGAGWYYAGTLVNLVAPSPPPGWIIPNVARWVFDHWTLDGVTQSPPNPTLVVTMNTNHTATVFYHRESFLYLADDIGNQSGIADTGKWYVNSQQYTWNAPMYVQLDSNHRYGFKYWTLSTLGIVGYLPTITLHVNSTGLFDGATLKAVYHMQYYLELKSKPLGVPGYLYPDSDVTGWYDAGRTMNLKAKPLITASSTSRYVFVQWRNHLGGTNPANNITFTMLQPWTVTAEYDLEYLAKWAQSPSSITVPGFPGQTWIKNGTDVWYGAPQYDSSGMFQFYYWKINSVTYPQGAATVNVGICTGPIDGTAYYANMTRMFMSPSRHDETAHAYCNTFDVTVYAANFDALRLIGGEPQDIYGFDIRLKWDPTLLEVQSVTLNLASFFAPNSYFIAKNEIDNTAGTYRLSATVKGNYTGFSGTKAIFTLQFHVIYDPCYPNDAWTWIEFDPLQRQLANHLGHSVGPEMGWNDCYYKISTVKPMLEIRDPVDGDNTIIVHKNAPQPTYFDAQVWLLHGVKVHDYYVIVDYDETQIEAMSVTIADYLKPPYTAYTWWISKGVGLVYVWVVQDSSVPLQNCSGLLFTIRFKVIKAIYYTMPGPDHLTSDITIAVGTYISAKCPTPILQYYPTDLGVVKAQYIYNPLPGDLDYDGMVTVLDLQLVADNYNSAPAKYDITGDGKTDLYDLVFVALRFGDHI
jgi:hypothetical protein